MANGYPLMKKQKTAVLHLVSQQCKIEEVIEEVITCSIPALDYRMYISTPNWPTTTRKLIAALIHIALILPKKVTGLVITTKKHFANMARAIYETPVHALHTLCNKTYGPSWLTWRTLIAQKDLTFVFEHDPQLKVSLLGVTPFIKRYNTLTYARTSYNLPGCEYQSNTICVGSVDISKMLPTLPNGKHKYAYYAGIRCIRMRTGKPFIII
ncbi:hypothetical protein C2G38_2327093 [Gigaspora rosea]|uniref:Uncharacterized protein n=1 Tax=Gigaspora rosea TaxID=44941 RepID=A0A397UWC4_9GLOM|nr:hypothetical protein C2G38_2327093 [Gigaspora rosea]